MFLAGGVAYAFRGRIRYDWRIASLAALVLVVTSVGDRPHSYTWPIVVPYLTLWAAFTPAIRLHRLVERVGGDYSYGTYLYAFPTQQACVRWLGCAGHPLLLFVIATPLTIAVAVLSWRLVERPFLPKRRAPAEALPPQELVAVR